jgi:hypothetical protein
LKESLDFHNQFRFFKKIFRRIIMGFDLAMAKSGINHVYQAAREAKEKGTDQLTAARQAAEKDGNLTGIEESFIDSLEKDPGLLDRVIEVGEDIVIKDFDNCPPESNSVNKNLEFVEDKKPSLKEMSETFKKEFGSAAPLYLAPDNLMLVNKLKKIGEALTADPKATDKLVNYAVNMAVNIGHPDNEDLEAGNAENRAKDLAAVFEKARKNDPLNKDDIKTIQMFTFMDTDYGRLLHEKEGESGIDGLFGPRTNFALNLLLKDQNLK